MTLINFDLRAVAATGRVPVDGRIRWQATERRTDGGVVLLPEVHAVQLVDGLASADLDPGYYVFTEVHPNGESALRLVPTVGPVNYAALAGIDPATMEPTAQPEAAWYSAINTLEAVAQDAADSAAAAQAAASGSQGSAAGSATAAAGSATAAQGSADSAAGSATAAAGSAATASNHATTAAGHVTAAAQQVTLATNQASAAAGSAVQSADSAVAAAGSKDAAASSASMAESTRTSMVVSGSVDDVTGHLFLGRVAADPVDAGYVVGPPVSVTVGEVETGPETPGATGATGLTGPKGDPGGIVDGTELGTANLNNVTVSGIYKQTLSSANTSLANNYPFTGVMAILTVLRARSTDILQIVEPANGVRAGSVSHRRASADGGSTWSAWRTFASQRLNQDAGRAIYSWDDVINREQLVYGDTGLRSVSALRNANSSAGTAYVRRDGRSVTFHMTGVSMAVTGAGFVSIFDAATALPVGFRPPVGGFRTVAATASGEARLLEFLSDGGIQIYAPSMSVYSASITFQTNDIWPLALPGTAYGAIPNL